MSWAIRSNRLRKVEEHLERVGIESRSMQEDAAANAELRRRVAVSELIAAACLALVCRHEINETAAGLVGRFRAFPEAEWPALFGEARALLRRTTSARDWPARSGVLEALFAAVQSPVK